MTLGSGLELPMRKTVAIHSKLKAIWPGALFQPIITGLLADIPSNVRQQMALVTLKIKFAVK